MEKKIKDKELLTLIVFEAFMDDKISYKKYNKMAEFVDKKMSDEDVSQFLTEQGDLTYKRKTVHSAVGALGSVAASAGVGYITYRLLKGIFSKCARSCGMFGINTLKRQMCLAKCKAMVADKEVQELQKVMGQCSNSGNPEKCKEGLRKRLVKAQEKAKNARMKLQKIQQYGIKKGQETPSDEEAAPGKLNLI